MGYVLDLGGGAFASVSDDSVRSVYAAVRLDASVGYLTVVSHHRYDLRPWGS